jgi:hypothetical protein
MRWEGVIMDAERGIITIWSAGDIVVKECALWGGLVQVTTIQSSAVSALLRGGGRDTPDGIQFFTTSLQQLTTTLNMAVPQAAAETEDGAQLPAELESLQALFDPEKAYSLPLHRGRMDYHIRLKKRDDGSLPDLLWGLLYSMSRDQLLELHQQVTGLMDKGWIWASSSSAGAPVILISKPSRGWRLCVDYRGLNKVTEVDRYPLPLIKETLRTLSRAR